MHYRKNPVEPYAFIRLKNEILTVEACLNSIKGAIKKGVVAYHKLPLGEKDDGTIAFIERFCQENPGFKPYYYPYEVIPPNDSRYVSEEYYEKEQALDAYYNAVLAQIPENEWLIKIDGDHIFDGQRLEELFYLPKSPEEYIVFPRLNLHYSKGKLYILKHMAPIISHGDSWLIYKKNLHFSLWKGYDDRGKFFVWEHLDDPKAKKIETGLFNYHFPCMKADRTVSMEDLIPYEQWSLDKATIRQYDIKPYFIDEDYILEQCKSFDKYNHRANDRN